MKIKDLAKALDMMFPKEHQESFDNCGLIIGNPEQECTGVITCLDVVPAIIEEAVKKGCNVIVSHHPLILAKGVRTLLDNTFVSRIIMDAIKNNISIYAAHTSVDNRFQQSLSWTLAKNIGLENIEPLRRTNASNYGIDMGAGAIGNLPEPQYAVDFLFALRERMKLTCPIRYNQMGKNTQIKKIAVCGGAGAFLLDYAKKAGADMYITGDVGYHPFFEETDIYLADMGHYDSERHAPEVLVRLMREYCQVVSKSVVSSSGAIEGVDEGKSRIMVDPDRIFETEITHVSIAFAF